MAAWDAHDLEIRQTEERAVHAIREFTRILSTKGIERIPTDTPHLYADLGWMFGEDVKLRSMERFAYGGPFRRNEGFLHVLTSDDCDPLLHTAEYTTLLFRAPELTGDDVLAIRFTGTALRHCTFFALDGTGINVLYWNKLQEIGYELFQAAMGRIKDPFLPGEFLSYDAMVATTLGSLKGAVHGLEEAEHKGISRQDRPILDRFWRLLDRVFPPKRKK